MQVVHAGAPLQAANAEGTLGIVGGAGRTRGAGRIGCAGRVGKVVEEVGRRREEQAAGDGRGEIEDAVGVARRLADEHADQHPLGHARRGRVGDVVGAELPAPHLAERHVGSDDLPLGSVGLHDGVHGHVRVDRLDLVRHLDVGELVAADHLLLLLGAQGVPEVQRVHVLLHDDVTAAGEGRIGVADQGRYLLRLADRVLGAVDEAHQVPLVEVPEAVYLVHHGGRAGQLGHGLGRELEAHVHPFVPDMEQQVPWRGGSLVHGTGERAEPVQLGRARASEQAVPRVRADPGDGRHRAFRGPEAYRPSQAGPALQQVPAGRLAAGVDGQDQEDRIRGERGQHRLRFRRNR